MLLRRAPLRSIAAAARGIQTTAKPGVPGTLNAPATNPSDVPALDGPPATKMAESVEAAEKARHMQAPNRSSTWSRSQRPRELGMTGPRFEQTLISQQPAPYAAIELIHQQPVRWSEKRVVACDGGRLRWLCFGASDLTGLTQRAG